MEVKTDERIINFIKRKIENSKNIVAVLGIEMLVESGGYDLDTNDENYRVEEEYGFCPEDRFAFEAISTSTIRFLRSV
mgnify:CR=1 FL=1